MGGGGDSRIPSILRDLLGPGYSIFIKTYDFDPEIATEQLASWASEVKPDLVIGESESARQRDRQPLHFARRTLLKWPAARKEAMRNTPLNGSRDYFHAFFGTHDKFRRSGVVMIRTWRKYFGEGSWTVYDGTHFMEEEYIRSLLVPKILSLLD